MEYSEVNFVMHTVLVRLIIIRGIFIILGVFLLTKKRYEASISAITNCGLNRPNVLFKATTIKPHCGNVCNSVLTSGF